MGQPLTYEDFEDFAGYNINEEDIRLAKNLYYFLIGFICICFLL